MRAASVELIAALAEEVTTLSRLLEMTRPDGTTLYFTDSDRDVEYDSGDGENTYRADVSFSSSAIFTSSTFANAQNVTLYVAMSDDGITEADVRAKRYKRAVARIFIIDRLHPEWGAFVVFKGTVGRIELTDKHRLTMEVVPRSKGGFDVIAGEVYSPTCRWNLFDAGCGLDKEDFKELFTVDSAVGNVFVASELNQADGHWVLGQIKWLTGLNANTFNIVAQSDQSSTSVTVVEAPLNPIAVGDTGEIFPGCSKQLSTCRDVYNNVDRMRGEPYVPQIIVYRQPSTTNVALTAPPPAAP